MLNGGASERIKVAEEVIKAAVDANRREISINEDFIIGGEEIEQHETS